MFPFFANGFSTGGSTTYTRTITFNTTFSESVTRNHWATRTISFTTVFSSSITAALAGLGQLHWRWVRFVHRMRRKFRYPKEL